MSVTVPPSPFAGQFAASIRSVVYIVLGGYRVCVATNVLILLFALGVLLTSWRRRRNRLQA